MDEFAKKVEEYRLMAKRVINQNEVRQFVKNELWKQANPADQLTVIRASLEGHLSNWNDGIINVHTFRNELDLHLKQIKELEPFLKGAKWN